MKSNKRIAVFSDSLGAGGAERFAGLLSLILENLGYEVYNIIIQDRIDYPYRGKLVNLDRLCKSRFNWTRKFEKARILFDFLNSNNIEIIIDNRARPTLYKELVNKIIFGKRKVYYMIHSSMLDMYVSKSLFWTQCIYKNAVKLVCVSEDIEKLINEEYAIFNTRLIYNPVVLDNSKYEKNKEVPDNYILFFGRLEEKVKNFSLLLDAFSYSKIYDLGYKLLIIGDGSSNGFIKSKIDANKLNDFVILLPFQTNISSYVKYARYTVLSSHYEGFPMSILESLSLETPVVSVDCETGPREIIKNEYNGLLVDNHNVSALSEAMRRMIVDEKLYFSCKNNALKSVEHLSLANISKQWLQLLSE